MPPLRELICPAALLASVSISVAPKSASSLAPTGLDLEAINASVSTQLKEGGIPGVAIVIVRDGKIELASAYGVRSLESGDPVTSHTRFAIGSVTKQFTSACVLLLAEDGQVSVHDKVAKYFPDLTRANDISLLDLMNHVSGYPDYYPLDFVDRRMASPIGVDELIRRYAGGRLDFEPGARYSYSNTGFIILGRVVETVSGLPFGTFLERRILRPLGMTNTLYEPKERGAQFAEGYHSFALGPLEKAKPEAGGWIAAAGGIFSTAADLAKWDLALLEGTLLKPESWAIMTAPRKLKDGRISDYGCGLALATQNGFPVLRHNGAVSGFLAYNSMIPATRSAVIVLANCENGPAASRLHSGLFSLLTPKTSAVPAVAGPNAVNAARAFFRELQSGRIDRRQLGEEFDFYLTPEKVRGAAARLKPYGAPSKADLARSWERGGMEVAVVRFTFKSGVLEALMYRTPDGKIQQFFVSRE